MGGRDGVGLVGEALGSGVSGGSLAAKEEAEGFHHFLCLIAEVKHRVLIDPLPACPSKLLLERAVLAFECHYLPAPPDQTVAQD